MQHGSVDWTSLDWTSLPGIYIRIIDLLDAMCSNSREIKAITLASPRGSTNISWNKEQIELIIDLE
jgi:hypothetical protein